jgi:predicted RNase H-like HicB family nuclease
MKEIIFEIREDAIDDGYFASALGYGIHTEADSDDELKRNIREAVDCYFDDIESTPQIIRLHYVKDEILV